MSDVTKSSTNKCATPQLKKKPQPNHNSITSQGKPLQVHPHKQINCKINYELQYRKQISLFSEKPFRALSIEGFLNEHPFISPRCDNAQSIQALETLKHKFINQWRVPKPSPISLRTRVMKILDKLQQLDVNLADMQSGIVFSSWPLTKAILKRFYRCM
jgi:hypothetical protein